MSDHNKESHNKDHGDAGHGHAKVKPIVKHVAVKGEVSSIFPSAQPEKIEGTQFMMPTWFLMSVLVVCFFLLKSFIYTKDEKRHGK